MAGKTLSSVITTNAAWGKGFKLIMVRPDQVRPNSHNPNKMDDATFAKEKLSIETNGFIDPIKVREVGKGVLEIVDGEHRWRVAGELGLTRIPAINLGPIPDVQAKKLTIISNELRGSPEPVLLSALIKELAETTTSIELSNELPMTSAEIDAMIKSASVFDWNAISESGGANTAFPAGQKPRAPETENDDVGQVKIGKLKADIPAAMVEAFYKEYENTAAVLGSKTPELVFKDWLSRLASTAKVAPGVVPRPRKTLKKKEKAA